MSLDNFWKRRRAERDAKATKTVTGIDPRLSSAGADLQSVRLMVATMVRELFDKGVDPIELIRMYLAGAVWLADNAGVSREQLIEAIKLMELKKDRQLIYTP